MTPEVFADAARRFVETSPANRVGPDEAIAPELVGLRLYDPPLVTYGDPGNPYYQILKHDEVLSTRHLSPREWLPGAQTVVALFLPAADGVQDSNAGIPDRPSPAWLHARIEGQRFILELCAHLAALLEHGGHAAVVPASNPRFWCGLAMNDPAQTRYASNWSERHVAHACGLGTFCLSKGVITEKGVCGRFASIITTASFPRTVPSYSGLFDHCTFCGACARNCPAGAIDPKTGKDHVRCHEYCRQMLETYHPRHGCGKCQVNVPCQRGIPRRARA